MFIYNKLYNLLHENDINNIKGNIGGIIFISLMVFGGLIGLSIESILNIEDSIIPQVIELIFFIIAFVEYLKKHTTSVIMWSIISEIVILLSAILAFFSHEVWIVGIMCLCYIIQRIFFITSIISYVRAKK